MKIRGCAATVPHPFGCKARKRIYSRAGNKDKLFVEPPSRRGFFCGKNLNMAIYTKKGDKGRTSLGSGVKAWKDSVRVEAYGMVDELNASLGVVASECTVLNKGYSKYLEEIVHQIQDDLFCIGSYLSNPANANLIELLQQRTTVFEKYIDEMTEKMPELSNFILPGGGKIGALFQFSRTISRSAERKIVSLSKKAKINEGVLQYINRLSDLLFTMGRYANYNEHVSEVIWKRR